KGKMVGEFVGALPEPRLKMWLEEYLPTEEKEALMAIRERLGNPETTEAAVEELREFAAKHPDLPLARLILSSITVFDAPKDAMEDISDIKVGHIFYESAENVRTLGELMTFESEEENGAASKLRTAQEGLTDKDFEKALEAAIEAVEVDKSHSNDLPRRGAIAIMRFLGPQHPLTARFRRKFEMALY
ncbi:MAG: tetratricopeptide repeat protein, partial [Bacteroidota bacterium]